MSALQDFKQWAKHSSTPSARLVRRVHKNRHAMEVPKTMTKLYKPLYNLHRFINGLWESATKTLYWTPLFKSQIQGTMSRLNLYGGLPHLSGPLHIKCGDDCRISGATTFSGRTAGLDTPELIISDNVGIGWQTTIAVGRLVKLGKNVRMGGRNFLAGYPGHPIDPKLRAAGMPDLDKQVGDIILERDVWLGTGAMVMAGVTIGRGSIIAAGSVVTKSIPPNVLAGGNPARVIKPLNGPNMEIV